MKDLIYHTNGLPDSEISLALSGYEDYDYLTRERFLRWINRSERQINKPGEAFEYSNSGYVLLAEIIQNVAGRSFSHWMKENIFLPLGMESSLIREDIEAIIPEMAYSYIRYRDATEHVISPMNFSYPGACCQRSSLKEMIQWVINLENNTLGINGIQELINTKGRLKNGEESRLWLRKFSHHL